MAGQRRSATDEENMKPKSTKSNYTTSPSAPSPTFGLRTDARGRILIDADEAQSLSVEVQLTIILFALAGRRYVADPRVFRDMQQRVVHLLDEEHGGIRADAPDFCKSPDVMAASEALRHRIHERSAQQHCVALFVAGIDSITTAAEIAELFDEWNVQHVHLAKSAGKYWAKVYLPPIEADAARDYYENRDAVIRGRKIRITKSVSPSTELPPPAGATEAS
jgi:hypothetical protein